jgi:hypothetical protein
MTRRRQDTSGINDQGAELARDTRDNEEFYEAMPATSSERAYYRDEPDALERDDTDRTALSGWAVIGLILLALVALLLLFGRGSSSVPATNTAPTNAPATTPLNQ